MPDLTFGVEIEFNTNLSESAVADRLQRGGVNTATARRLDNPGAGVWGVKHDGSIGRGWEVVSPILSGEAGIAETMRVCNILSGIPDARATEACGLHVHVGGFDDDAAKIRAIKNTARRFVNHEDSMDAIHREPRRGNNNQYCRSNYRVFGENLGAATRVMWDRIASVQTGARYSSELSQLVQVISPDRYVKFNTQSLLRHGTVEFRQHAGSIDGQEITNWIRFVTGFVAQSIAQEDVQRRAARRPRDERFRKMLTGVDIVTQANMWTRRAAMSLTPAQEAAMRTQIAGGQGNYEYDQITGAFRRREAVAQAA